MNDLISRPAAIAELMQMVKAHEHEIFRGELLHYTGIKAMLEAQPAVDAAPVKHGRWVADSDGLPVCSVCNAVAMQRLHCNTSHRPWMYDVRLVKTPYCPDMRRTNGW